MDSFCLDSLLLYPINKLCRHLESLSHHSHLHQANQHLSRGWWFKEGDYNYVIFLARAYTKVLESGLPWKMVLYGEEGEVMMAQSQNPIIRTIWEDKIVEDFAPIPKVFKSKAHTYSIYIGTYS